ncbi:hypothetical protein M404DRAFT_31962 [Pisolithus tinctorius Marx 270]|uniref:Palmitoyltransferase n=1 Tax=Pisolithus tinctorius Marx 270 TaxID=870435 RepID=A0A0C3JJI4_PISTI|nr:hypothetical protein M404DRAFT_31962 [Pisolithus tinctorius Marx 270]
MTFSDRDHCGSAGGDLSAIRELVKSGKATVNDRDSQNLTPLHYAQLATCRYLIEQGAEVDAVEGDLQATPLQRAARNGHLCVIHLLISRNADPNFTDTQGYNALYLVTHSSSVMPLLYLLHQPVNVDSRDMQGHTPLMWAAYRGDALSVDLLLKHSANPDLKDDVGLSPLHWAVVRGNRAILRRLVEVGADIHAKDTEGRTPRDMAVELKSFGAWKRSMEEGGMNEFGVKKAKPLSERNTHIAIFVLPALFLYIIFTILSILPWCTGMVPAMAEFFALHHIVTCVLLNKVSYVETVKQSPYFVGIIAGSMTWVGYAWVTRLATQPPNHPFIHLAFALNIGLCVYNFFRAIMLDPGTCPRPVNDGELKAIIEDLASEGRLNGQTFCIQCMAKKPLRSKHCRMCDRCVARSDHHCPWIWNCVGSNNHRQFLMFVTTLVTGIILFDYLTYEFYASATAPDNIAADCSPIFCVPAAIDSFLLSVSLWSTLQLTWTSVLLLTQFWQVARQLTTLEVSNLGRYGSMGGRGGLAAGSGATGIQMGHRHHHAVNNDRGDEESEGEGEPKHRHHHVGLCKALSAPGTCGAFLLNLVGLDRFTRGRAAHGLALGSSSARAWNPFDLGLVRNCRDFWTMGKEVGVDYGQVYDVPAEGFEEGKRKRDAERGEFERDHDGGSRSKSLLAKLGLRMTTSLSRRGYEPLSQV